MTKSQGLTADHQLTSVMLF